MCLHNEAKLVTVALRSLYYRVNAKKSRSSGTCVLENRWYESDFCPWFCSEHQIPAAQGLRAWQRSSPLMMPSCWMEMRRRLWVMETRRAGRAGTGTETERWRLGHCLSPNRRPTLQLQAQAHLITAIWSIRYKNKTHRPPSSFFFYVARLIPLYLLIPIESGKWRRNGQQWQFFLQ